MKEKVLVTTMYQQRSLQHSKQTRLMNYLLVCLIAFWLAGQYFLRTKSYQEIEI